MIGYDGLTSYGSPAYWAQQMFSTHHGDLVLPIDAQAVPTRTLFFDATRDGQTGEIFLKIVNRAATPQPIRVELSGIANVDPKGQSIALTAASPTDTNSITEPTKIVPVTAPVDGLAKTFTRTFPPYSITLLTMKAK